MTLAFALMALGSVLVSAAHSINWCAVENVVYDLDTQGFNIVLNDVTRDTALDAIVAVKFPGSFSGTPVFECTFRKHLNLEAYAPLASAYDDSLRTLTFDLKEASIDQGDVTQVIKCTFTGATDYSSAPDTTTNLYLNGNLNEVFAFCASNADGVSYKYFETADPITTAYGSGSGFEAFIPYAKGAGTVVSGWSDCSVYVNEVQVIDTNTDKFVASDSIIARCGDSGFQVELGYDSGSTEYLTYPSSSPQGLNNDFGRQYAEPTLSTCSLAGLSASGCLPWVLNPANTGASEPVILEQYVDFGSRLQQFTATPINVEEPDNEYRINANITITDLGSLGISAADCRFQQRNYTSSEMQSFDLNVFANSAVRQIVINARDVEIFNFLANEPVLLICALHVSGAPTTSEAAQVKLDWFASKAYLSTDASSPLSVNELLPITAVRFGGFAGFSTSALAGTGAIGILEDYSTNSQGDLAGVIGSASHLTKTLFDNMMGPGSCTLYVLGNRWTNTTALPQAGYFYVRDCGVTISVSMFSSAGFVVDTYTSRSAGMDQYALQDVASVVFGPSFHGSNDRVGSLKVIVQAHGNSYYSSLAQATTGVSRPALTIPQGLNFAAHHCKAKWFDADGTNLVSSALLSELPSDGRTYYFPMMKTDVASDFPAFWLSVECFDVSVDIELLNQAKSSFVYTAGPASFPIAVTVRDFKTAVNSAGIIVDSNGNDVARANIAAYSDSLAFSTTDGVAHTATLNVQAYPVAFQDAFNSATGAFEITVQFPSNWVPNAAVMCSAFGLPARSGAWKTDGIAFPQLSAIFVAADFTEVPSKIDMVCTNTGAPLNGAVIVAQPTLVKVRGMTMYPAYMPSDTVTFYDSVITKEYHGKAITMTVAAGLNGVTAAVTNAPAGAFVTVYATEKLSGIVTSFQGASIAMPKFPVGTASSGLVLPFGQYELTWELRSKNAGTVFATAKTSFEEATFACVQAAGSHYVTLDGVLTRIPLPVADVVVDDIDMGFSQCVNGEWVSIGKGVVPVVTQTTARAAAADVSLELGSVLDGSFVYFDLLATGAKVEQTEPLALFADASYVLFVDNGFPASVIDDYAVLVFADLTGATASTKDCRVSHNGVSSTLNLLRLRNNAGPYIVSCAPGEYTVSLVYASAGVEKDYVFTYKLNFVERVYVSTEAAAATKYWAAPSVPAGVLVSGVAKTVYVTVPNNVVGAKLDFNVTVGSDKCELSTSTVSIAVNAKSTSFTVTCEDTSPIADIELAVVFADATQTKYVFTTIDGVYNMEMPSVCDPAELSLGGAFIVETATTGTFGVYCPNGQNLHTYDSQLICDAGKWSRTTFKCGVVACPVAPLNTKMAAWPGIKPELTYNTATVEDDHFTIATLACPAGFTAINPAAFVTKSVCVDGLWQNIAQLSFECRPAGCIHYTYPNDPASPLAADISLNAAVVYTVALGEEGKDATGLPFLYQEVDSTALIACRPGYILAQAGVEVDAGYGKAVCEFSAATGFAWSNDLSQYTCVPQGCSLDAILAKFTGHEEFGLELDAAAYKYGVLADGASLTGVFAGCVAAETSFPADKWVCRNGEIVNKFVNTAKLIDVAADKVCLTKAEIFAKGCNANTFTVPNGAAFFEQDRDGEESVFTGIAHLDSVAVQCDAGFKRNPEAQFVCYENDIIPTSAAPACIDSKCPIPVGFFAYTHDSAIVTKHDIVVEGQQITFACAADTDMILGVHVNKCLPGNVWSHALPQHAQCQKASCGPFEGAAAIVSRLAGYAAGAWTANANEGSIIVDDTVNLPGFVKPIDFQIGSTVEFECNQAYFATRETPAFECKLTAPGVATWVETSTAPAGGAPYTCALNVCTTSIAQKIRQQTFFTGKDVSGLPIYDKGFAEFVFPTTGLGVQVTPYDNHNVPAGTTVSATCADGATPIGSVDDAAGSATCVGAYLQPANGGWSQQLDCILTECPAAELYTDANSSSDYSETDMVDVHTNATAICAEGYVISNVGKNVAPTTCTPQGWSLIPVCVPRACPAGSFTAADGTKLTVTTEPIDTINAHGLTHDIYNVECDAAQYSSLYRIAHGARFYKCDAAAGTWGIYDPDLAADVDGDLGRPTVCEVAKCMNIAEVVGTGVQFLADALLKGESTTLTCAAGEMLVIPQQRDALPVPFDGKITCDASISYGIDLEYKPYCIPNYCSRLDTGKFGATLKSVADGTLYVDSSVTDLPLGDYTMGCAQYPGIEDNTVVVLNGKTGKCAIGANAVTGEPEAMFIGIAQEDLDAAICKAERCPYDDLPSDLQSTIAASVAAVSGGSVSVSATFYTATENGIIAVPSSPSFLGNVETFACAAGETIALKYETFDLKGNSVITVKTQDTLQAKCGQTSFDQYTAYWFVASPIAYENLVSVECQPIRIECSVADVFTVVQAHFGASFPRFRSIADQETYADNVVAVGESIWADCSETDATDYKTQTLLGSTTITCTRDGWKAPNGLPYCAPRTCATPPVGENMINKGYYQDALTGVYAEYTAAPAAFGYWDVMTYECAAGYTLQGNNAIRCYSDISVTEWRTYGNIPSNNAGAYCAKDIEIPLQGTLDAPAGFFSFRISPFAPKYYTNTTLSTPSLANCLALFSYHTMGAIDPSRSTAKCSVHAEGIDVFFTWGAKFQPGDVFVFNGGVISSQVAPNVFLDEFSQSFTVTSGGVYPVEPHVTTTPGYCGTVTIVGAYDDFANYGAYLRPTTVTISKENLASNAYEAYTPAGDANVFEQTWAEFYADELASADFLTYVPSSQKNVLFTRTNWLNAQQDIAAAPEYEPLLPTVSAPSSYRIQVNESLVIAPAYTLTSCATANTKVTFEWAFTSGIDAPNQAWYDKNAPVFSVPKNAFRVAQTYTVRVTVKEYFGTNDAHYVQTTKVFAIYVTGSNIETHVAIGAFPLTAATSAKVWEHNAYDADGELVVDASRTRDLSVFGNLFDDRLHFDWDCKYKVSEADGYSDCSTDINSGVFNAYNAVLRVPNKDLRSLIDRANHFRFMMMIFTVKVTKAGAQPVAPVSVTVKVYNNANMYLVTGFTPSGYSFASATDVTKTLNNAYMQSLKGITSDYDFLRDHRDVSTVTRLPISSSTNVYGVVQNFFDNEDIVLKPYIQAPDADYNSIWVCDTASLRPLTEIAASAYIGSSTLTLKRTHIPRDTTHRCTFVLFPKAKNVVLPGNLRDIVRNTALMRDAIALPMFFRVVKKTTAVSPDFVEISTNAGSPKPITITAPEVLAYYKFYSVQGSTKTLLYAGVNNEISTVLPKGLLEIVVVALDHQGREYSCTKVFEVPAGVAFVPSTDSFAAAVASKDAFAYTQMLGSATQALADSNNAGAAADARATYLAQVQANTGMFLKAEADNTGAIEVNGARLVIQSVKSILAAPGQVNATIIESALKLQGEQLALLAKSPSPSKESAVLAATTFVNAFTATGSKGTESDAAFVIDQLALQLGALVKAALTGGDAATAEKPVEISVGTLTVKAFKIATADAAAVFSGDGVWGTTVSADLFKKFAEQGVLSFLVAGVSMTNMAVVAKAGSAISETATSPLVGLSFFSVDGSKLDTSSIGAARVTVAHAGGLSGADFDYPTCQFFKEGSSARGVSSEDDAWSTKGCAVFSRSATATVCECTHLTMFRARVGYTGAAAAVWLPLNDDNMDKNMTPLYMIFVWMGVFVVFMFIAVALDSTKKRDAVALLTAQWRTDAALGSSARIAAPKGISNKMSALMAKYDLLTSIFARDHFSGLASAPRMAGYLLLALTAFAVNAMFWGGKVARSDIGNYGGVIFLAALVLFVVNALIAALLTKTHTLGPKAFVYKYALELATLYHTGSSSFFTKADAATLQAGAVHDYRGVYQNIVAAAAAGKTQEVHSLSRSAIVLDKQHVLKALALNNTATGAAALVSYFVLLVWGIAMSVIICAFGLQLGITVPTSTGVWIGSSFATLAVYAFLVSPVLFFVCSFAAGFGPEYVEPKAEETRGLTAYDMASFDDYVQQANKTYTPYAPAVPVEVEAVEAQPLASAAEAEEGAVDVAVVAAEDGAATNVGAALATSEEPAATA